jgi:uncharacterized membrane protein
MKLGMFIMPPVPILTAYLMYALISNTSTAASKIVEAMSKPTVIKRRLCIMPPKVISMTYFIIPTIKNTNTTSSQIVEVITSILFVRMPEPIIMKLRTYHASSGHLNGVLHKFLPSEIPILQPLKFDCFNDFIAHTC